MGSPAAPTALVPRRRQGLFPAPPNIWRQTTPRQRCCRIRAPVVDVRRVRAIVSTGPGPFEIARPLPPSPGELQAMTGVALPQRDTTRTRRQFKPEDPIVYRMKSSAVLQVVVCSACARSRSDFDLACVIRVLDTSVDITATQFIPRRAKFKSVASLLVRTGRITTSITAPFGDKSRRRAIIRQRFRKHV
jgi:hypothetical protein